MTEPRRPVKSLVTFRCPHCLRAGEVASDRAGELGLCPGCQGRVRVSRGHCRSSADGRVEPDAQPPDLDPQLGERLFEVGGVPLALLDCLGPILCLGFVASVVGAGAEIHLLGVIGLFLLASAALIWVVVELQAGRQTVLLAEGGLRLPTGEAIDWVDVGSFSPGHLPHARFTIETPAGAQRLGAEFCLNTDRHWWRLLWPPNRERIREQLHRKAMRELRVLEQAEPRRARWTKPMRAGRHLGAAEFDARKAPPVSS